MTTRVAFIVAVLALVCSAVATARPGTRRGAVMTFPRNAVHGAVMMFQRNAVHADQTCDGFPVQMISVRNQAGVEPWYLELIERAVAQQSLQLRREWGTRCVVFGPGGWPLTLLPSLAGTACAGDGGCHWEDDRVRMLVQTQGTWSAVVSHEVIESLVDPSGTGHEICDPLDYVWYQGLGGVRLQAFEPPSYFS